MAAKWQYRNDDFKFVDFTKKDSTELEKAWSRNDPKMPLTIKGNAYTVDLVHFTQTNDTTKRERLIRRLDSDVKTGGKHVWTRGPVWEWESHPGVFTPYDAVTNDIIERAFMKDAIRVQVKLDVSAHEKKDFVVHFGHMHQENPEGTGVRKVRRVVKDIAPSSAKSTEADDASDDKSSRQKHLETKKRERDEEPKAADADKPRPPVAAKTEATKATTTAVASNDAPLPQLEDWKKLGTVLYLPLKYKADTGKVMIAGFDMDDTLVMPPSGATFAKSRTDWKWLAPGVVPKLLELHNKGYRIVIFSNQSGIGNKGYDEAKASAIKGKIVDMSAACKIPIGAVIATKEDEFRKPCTAMWDDVYAKMCMSSSSTIDQEASFYCGDAAGRTITTLAGRKKDFSCSDRKFAYNLGVKFTTPEEFFHNEKPAPFHWDGLGPADLSAVATHYPKPAFHGAGKELVLFVGFPGCGKSTFYERFFKPHGYKHVNRDTLKTAEKCVAAVATFLSQGCSVVVDNTNPSAEDRAKYIAIAKKGNVPVRCFVMLHSAALANHMNILRARLGISDRVSSIAYNMFKSKYEAVDAKKEGVDEVIEVPAVADFSGLPPAAKQLFYQLS